MADTSKPYFLLTALLALTMPFMASSFRPLSSSKSNLAARMKLGGESPNCWGSLTQLQACSSQVLLFLFGETYLGHGCCTAIRTIEHQCWPSLLVSLGLSPEETGILEAFCNQTNQHETLSPPVVNVAAPPIVNETDLEKLIT